MKSLRQYLKEDWWEDLGSEGQEAYINAHPNSAKAKQAKAKNVKTKEIKTNKSQCKDYISNILNKNNIKITDETLDDYITWYGLAKNTNGYNVVIDKIKVYGGKEIEKAKDILNRKYDKLKNKLNITIAPKITGRENLVVAKALIPFNKIYK